MHSNPSIHPSAEADGKGYRFDQLNYSFVGLSIAVQIYQVGYDVSNHFINPEGLHVYSSVNR